MVLVAKLAAAS